jgi:hypothetical protein
MGRPTHEPKHLLDIDAEQNIGNSTNLQPQDGNGPVGGTTIPQTNPDRILQLSGPSKTAQTTSVVFTAARLTGFANNPSPGWAGPITGIVEFGNGGRFTRAEFDVPVGPYIGALQGAASNTEPQDGGVVVTVPTGVMRAYARYDNRLIQPILGSNPPISLAQALGVPFVGPGGPVAANAGPNFAFPAEPVLVKAMAAYYTRHFAKLWKTQYCYASAVGAAPIFIDPSINRALYCVPAFARSVRVLRAPSTSAMLVRLYDGLYGSPNITPLDQVAVAANTSPEILLSGNMNILSVSSATAADTVTSLALCYEIGL